jgi:mycothiol synthase
MLEVSAPGAMARAIPTDDGWAVDITPHDLDGGELVEVLGELWNSIAVAGGGNVSWWVEASDDRHRAAASRVGLTEERQVVQMRRPLPAEAPRGIAVRPFVPGVDDQRWLEVNNRAFVWHPDQGGWDQDRLEARLAEPWFDAAGFLVHDGTDGRMAGFCWTKIHAGTDPLVGEIYVIGVDPDHAGQGLGRELTLAGLDHLHRARGARIGMLYVEHDNAAAVRLYVDLGFEVHQVDRRFVGAIAPGPPG